MVNDNFGGCGNPLVTAAVGIKGNSSMRTCQVFQLDPRLFAQISADSLSVRWKRKFKYNSQKAWKIMCEIFKNKFLNLSPERIEFNFSKVQGCLEKKKNGNKMSNAPQ